MQKALFVVVMPRETNCPITAGLSIWAMAFPVLFAFEQQNTRVCEMDAMPQYSVGELKLLIVDDDLPSLFVRIKA